MNIGSKIKALRKKKDMTLQELSRKSGVALATLSRIENDKMTGTIQAHTSICRAMGVSISELYRELEDTAKTVEPVPALERTEHLSRSRKTAFELLTSNPRGKKMMPVLIKLSPGGRTDRETSKPGSEKFIYMISGAIETDVAGKKYHLKKGDSLYFDASLPHSLRNESGSASEALCVMTAC